VRGSISVSDEGSGDNAEGVIGFEDDLEDNVDGVDGEDAMMDFRFTCCGCGCLLICFWSAQSSLKSSPPFCFAPPEEHRRVENECRTE